MELFLWFLAALLHVLFPPLSHSIQACTHRDRTLSLGLAAFCNGVPAEHYREVRSSHNYSVSERRRKHTDWNSSSIERSIWQVVHGYQKHPKLVSGVCISSQRNLGHTTSHLIWNKNHVSSSIPLCLIQANTVMTTVFWDQKGVLLVGFMTTVTTVNADRYCETLTKLRRAIQNRRRGMLSKGVSILHDNARPNAALQTVTLLQRFGWNIITHPPYMRTWPPVTSTSFRSWKNICPECASTTTTRWKMQFNASSTAWRWTGMTWAYQNYQYAYRNASVEMAIM